MSTFACIAGLALIVLSLSYLVSALPAVSVKIPVITGVDPCSRVLSKLFVDIEVKVNALRMSEYSLIFSTGLTDVVYSWVWHDSGTNGCR